MRFLDLVQARTLAILALIATFVAAVTVSPFLPYTTLHAQQVGPGGVPGKGGSGAVSSVFGRTGAVVAESGDYTASQVTDTAAINVTNMFTAPQTVNSGANGDDLTFDGYSNWTFGAHTGEDLLMFQDSKNSLWMPLFGNDSGSFSTGAIGMTLAYGSCYLWNGGNSYPVNVFTGLCNTGYNEVALGDGSPADTSGWLELSAIGNGSSGNTDLRGHLTAASNDFSYTFTKTYTVAPTCVMNDTTAHSVPTFTVSTTTLSGTTSGASDSVTYICAD